MKLKTTNMPLVQLLLSSLPCRPWSRTADRLLRRPHRTTRRPSNGWPWARPWPCRHPPPRPRLPTPTSGRRWACRRSPRRRLPRRRRPRRMRRTAPPASGGRGLYWVFSGGRRGRRWWGRRRSGWGFAAWFSASSPSLWWLLIRRRGGLGTPLIGTLSTGTITMVSFLLGF